MLVAARAAGVRVPEPIAYLGELDGREAFVMELVRGETIGRRIVKAPPAGLALQMAEELARIHSIPPGTVPFLPRPDLWQRLYAELDTVDEPHPAIELGISWCRERLPLERPRVVSHGDFRIGNLMLDETGIVAVLDWEFAHVSDPAEDLAWPLIRAWRFGNDGKRVGGIGDDRAVPRALRRADGRLDLFRGARRMGGIRQLQMGGRGPHPGPEAPSGRAAQRRARDPRASRSGDGIRAARPDREDGMSAGAPTDRPTASELATAVREFLDRRDPADARGSAAPISHARRDERALDHRARGRRPLRPRLGRRASNPGRRHSVHRPRRAEGRGGGEAGDREPQVPRPVLMRRRLYLMRHGAVSYFGADGQPVDPRIGVAHRGGASTRRALRRDLLAGDRLRSRDRERAPSHARDRGDRRARARRSSPGPRCARSRAGGSPRFPITRWKRRFVRAFHGVVPNETRFLGGESIGSLFDRVLPELDRLVADRSGTRCYSSSTGPSTARSSPTRSPASGASSASSNRPLERQRPRCRRRRLDRARRQHRALRPPPPLTRATTMERYWEQYRPLQRPLPE